MSSEVERGFEPPPQTVQRGKPTVKGKNLTVEFWQPMVSDEQEAVDGCSQEDASQSEGQRASTSQPTTSDAVGRVRMPGISSFDIPASRVLSYKCHGKDYFVCAWHPTQNLLASGSPNNSPSIWNFHERGASSQPFDSYLGRAEQGDQGEAGVWSMNWNSDGTMIVTGSRDGVPRIYSAKGKLLSCLQGVHKSTVLQVKFNKKSNCVLSVGVGRTAIISDVSTRESLQQFSLHTSYIVDTDWRNDTSFASGSCDSNIHVCELHAVSPVRTFTGHTDQVNVVKWDHQGNLLASGSEDCSVKIWTMQDSSHGGDMVHDLKTHTKGVDTIRWSPSGPGTANPNMDLVLASASSDSTICLWEAERGRCLRSLTEHTDSVCSVAFSPDGRYLASGSADKRVYIWSTMSGLLMHSHMRSAHIFDVQWNAKGDKLAACSVDGTLTVLDLRMQ